tara:strand:- start:17298 stop:20543 length:3246 start_codon:yes stop_codon:yes gene_type:complete
MRYFLLLSLVLFSLYGNAQEQALDSCGHVDGNVDPYSSTICKDDRAFNIMYSLFPNIYREVSEFSKLDELNDEELRKLVTKSGYSRADGVFELLYALFFDVSKWLLMIYVGLYLLDLLSRMLKDGSITQGGRHSPHTMVAGIMTSTALLIPAKGMFFGQVIVFVLSVVSLGLANTVHSTFVSAQQERIEVQWEDALTAEADGTRMQNAENFDTSTFKEDRHNYMARKFYQSLVMTELCRKQSADYLLKEVAQMIQPSEVAQFRSCMYGSDENIKMSSQKVSWDKEAGDTTMPSFMTLSVEEGAGINDDGTKILSHNNIAFELVPSTNPSCSIPKYENRYFQCGKMEFVNPNWEQSPFTSVVGGEFLQSVLMSVNSTINLSSSPEDIASKARNGWSTILQKINDEMGTWSEEDLSASLSANEMSVEDFNGYMRDKKELEEKREILFAKNSNALRQFAAFYYRSVMNNLMFGQVSSYLNDSSSINAIDNRSDFDSIVHHMKVVRPIAKIVEEANCTITAFNLSDSSKGLEYSNAASDTTPEGNLSFRCVDWETSSVLGLLSLDGLDEDAKRQKIIEHYNALSIKYEDELREAYITLANQRKALEAAFIEDSKMIRQENIWVVMRQEGFLSMANYAFVMNEEYQTVREHIRYITNNFNVSMTSAERQMLSMSLYYDPQKEGLAYPYFDEGRNVMSKVDDQFKSIDPLVSRASFVQSKMAIHFDKMYDDGMISSILRSLGDIWSFSSQFQSFGMSQMKLYQPGAKEACMNDVSKCPFPTKDPYIQLNQFGHSVVNASNAYLMSVASGKVFSMLVQRSGLIAKFTSRFTGNRGEIKSSNSILEKVQSKAYGFASAIVVGQVIAEFGGKIIDSTLVLVLMMWVLGAALAYLLPLIPFLFVYFGFVAWILIVFMTSFAVFIFSIYLVRFSEKRKDIVRSATHYAGQILFRLPLQYVSLIFAWYFFYAVSYFIANTIGLVNIGLGDGNGGGLFGFLYEIFAWITVAFVFFFGIKLCFDVVEDLTGELIKKLGMEHKDSKDKVNDVIKAVLFDQAQEAAQNVGQKGSKSKVSKERNLYEEAKKKLNEQGS